MAEGKERHGRGKTRFLKRAASRAPRTSSGGTAPRPQASGHQFTTPQNPQKQSDAPNTVKQQVAVAGALRAYRQRGSKRQTEGVTGSYRGGNKGRSGTEGTHEASGKGKSKGPTREQLPPKTQTSNSNPTARRPKQATPRKIGWFLTIF